MQQETSPSRRSFLQRIIAYWALAMSAPVLYVVLRYIIPPRTRERLLEAVTVAKTADIPASGVKRVKFNKKPVYLFRTAGGQIKALSGVCTHLGCVVEYISEESRFHCNCHSSVFSLEGTNLSGPAPRPLDSYRVEIKGEDVTIMAKKS